MDLQDIFVHVFLEVQALVVKVRNYINITLESCLNITVSTKEKEYSYKKKNFAMVQCQNIFCLFICAENKILKIIKVHFLESHFQFVGV